MHRPWLCHSRLYLNFYGTSPSKKWITPIQIHETQRASSQNCTQQVYLQLTYKEIVRWRWRVIKTSWWWRPSKRFSNRHWTCSACWQRLIWSSTAVVTVSCEARRCGKWQPSPHIRSNRDTWCAEGPWTRFEHAQRTAYAPASRGLPMERVGCRQRKRLCTHREGGTQPDARAAWEHSTLRVQRSMGIVSHRQQELQCAVVHKPRLPGYLNQE